MFREVVLILLFFVTKRSMKIFKPTKKFARTCTACKLCMAMAILRLYENDPLYVLYMYVHVYTCTKAVGDWYFVYVFVHVYSQHAQLNTYTHLHIPRSHTHIHVYARATMYTCTEKGLV